MGTLLNEPIEQVETSGKVYQFLGGSPIPGSGEYFLVENRQKVNFDEGLPSSGLLIWHIDESKATNDNTDNTHECYPGGPSCTANHYRVALVQADNSWDLEKKNNGGDSGDPFPGTCYWFFNCNTSFDSLTSPNSALYSGSPSGVSITNISSSGPVMTATLEAPVFLDVPSGYWAEDYIIAIYNQGITKGCSQYPLMYCPNQNVTRGQMAAFIIRSKYGETFSYTTTPYFTDVPSTHTFFKYVQKLRDDGITVVSGTYGVDNYVTRGQMAAFIIRAKFGENFSYTITPYFNDVPSTHTFFKYVQKLKDVGITAVTGTYNVDNIVTRAQMAAFLARAFLGMQ
jgi:hypothetical protein